MWRRTTLISAACRVCCIICIVIVGYMKANLWRNSCVQPLKLFPLSLLSVHLPHLLTPFLMLLFVLWQLFFYKYSPSSFLIFKCIHHSWSSYPLFQSNPSAMSVLNAVKHMPWKASITEHGYNAHSSPGHKIICWVEGLRLMSSSEFPQHVWPSFLKVFAITGWILWIRPYWNECQPLQWQ